MHEIHKYLCITGICLLNINIFPLWAKPTPAPTPLPEGRTSYRAYIWGDKPSSYFHWTAEKWTGDERPFLALVKQLDNEYKGSKKPTILLDKYRKAGQKQPLNAKSQFAWAYAAYLTHVYYKPARNSDVIISGVREALERPVSPNTIQYARMRAFFYLWDKKAVPGSMHFVLKAVIRLAKRNPKDFDLKYAFAYELAHSKKYNSIAMQWAQDFHKQYPKKPVGLYLLARVYESRFGLYLSEMDGKRAINYFKAFLTNAPKNNTYRKSAELHIAQIKQRTEKFRSAGWLKK